MKPPRKLANAGFVNPSTLPKGPNGRALCRYCGNEVPEGRKSFCSGERATFVYRKGDYLKPGSGCVHEHCIRSQPGYARHCVWARDHGHCALCPKVAPRNQGWQADHILPVVEGGGSCDLDNLRTLCTECHNRETAKLAARRAEARRNQREPPMTKEEKVVFDAMKRLRDWGESNPSLDAVPQSIKDDFVMTAKAFGDWGDNPDPEAWIAHLKKAAKPVTDKNEKLVGLLAEQARTLKPGEEMHVDLATGETTFGPATPATGPRLRFIDGQQVNEDESPVDELTRTAQEQGFYDDPPGPRPRITVPPDSYIRSRMESEDIDEEEANYRTWIDVHGDLIGHTVAVEAATEMRAKGDFKPEIDELAELEANTCSPEEAKRRIAYAKTVLAELERPKSLKLFQLRSPTAGTWNHADGSPIEHPEDISRGILAGLQKLFPDEGWELHPVEEP